MDTVITAPETTEQSTETASPGQTTGVGDVDPNTGSTGSSEGGDSQESTESSQSQAGARRKWSIQDEVKELRAQRRELREQVASSDQLREELRQLRDELNRRSQPGTAKTPANFWQDPEGTLDSKLDERLDRLQNNLFDRFSQTREQEFQIQALRQEQASATEFIRSQQGYDPSDDEDLVEIIGEIPNKQYMSPQWVAEYAWLKLNQQRGIGDRSLQKRQAAGIQGQPPGAGFGSKRWSKQEFDLAVDRVEKNPNDPKNTELFNELMAAHKEGRVGK